MKPKRYFVGEDHDQPGRDNQGRAHHLVRDRLQSKTMREERQELKRRVVKKSKKGKR